MESSSPSPPTHQWKVVLLLYLLSFVGDLFDGMAARAYDQCSTFGAVLDMLTDRVTTAGMLVMLGWIFPEVRGGG